MKLNKKISILGSTGSVGRSALRVIESIDGFEVVALSGHRNLTLLAAQARQFTPRFVVVSSSEDAESFGKSELLELPKGTEVLVGPESLDRIATLDEVDIVLAAIVGIAGLQSTYAAVQAGKRVALANKESLVVAGHLIEPMMASGSATLLPVDSEHSAVLQALTSGKKQEVARVTLTASGGPFRDWPADSLSTVTVEQALTHPTWNMGKKISIDSATMMNKSLELIEAKWLFDLKEDQLGVVIHPQSIVHSLVEYVDGSSIAQLSPPDMMLPIQYALTYPDRIKGPSPRLNLEESLSLEFLPPDYEKFPALKIGFEVVRMGGSCGAILNAANEAAVEAFIEQKIGFTDIAVACREVLDHHHFIPCPDMAEIIEADRWARQEISKWIAA
ncbi:MAG: 1-deoxy-D-xylulose-5-phosphate reductoisomerase [Planctomycetota bacterium]